MEILKTVLAEINALGLKGDAYCEENLKNETMVNDGEIDQIRQSDSFGCAVRVFKNGKMGFSYFTAKDNTEAKKAVKKAADTALIEGYETYTMPSFCKCTPPDTIDPDYNNITSKIRQDKALETEAAVKKYGKKVKFVRDTNLTDVKSSSHYMNTQGAVSSSDKTYFYCFTSAISSDGTAQEASEVMTGSCVFKDINAEALGREAAQKADMLLGGGALKTGRYDLILPPQAAVDFLQILAPLFYASNIRKGKSLFGSNKEGDTVASSILNINDDALLAFRAGSFGTDGEGTPGKNKMLIKHGRLMEFLYDIASADYFKKEPGGNGIRGSFKTLPECGVSNFYIVPGDSRKDIIMKGSGLIINSLMGLHTADPVSGNFSLGLNGWLLEKGEIKQAVKEMLVTGNIKDVLMNVKDVCEDSVFYFNYGSPTIVIGDMTAAGR
ncbi:MAG: TldD/PmbA family protein [Candidatus Goldbacteria bacterium]|nr:TldD/PmbA family protein [Candidatus Goldiibacteriota bacterium]